MLTRVFVYGSLKRGFSNHHFLSGQTFLSEVETLPVYQMFDYGGFPAVVAADGSQRTSILGEIWEVDGNCLKRLDWLEEIDHGLYVRGWAALPETSEEALIYLYNQPVDHLQRIENGVWLPLHDTGGSSPMPQL